MQETVNRVLSADGNEAGAIAPIEDYLAEVHGRISQIQGGAVADYIPELSKADPEAFGITIATVDGQVYSTGEVDVPFTIQSISKPFLYGYALQRYGREAVLEHVGVEPTGEAFNSIVLDQRHNRPFNPMVNAGAIAVAELVEGDTQEARIANMLAVFSGFAGRKLEIDEAVFRSELATGHRNRAIAYMMLNTGMIRRDPEEVLDLYFRQCAITITARDLAIMAATLANDGINPLTGESVISPDNVRDVLTVMNSCGMYNYAGQWSYEVGMPAKSGVSGAIIAAIPGQVGISVYSPPIDQHGNSVRGVEVCKALSSEFELHAFHNRTNVRAVVRREYCGEQVCSNRLRTPEERNFLIEEGAKIAVIEAQGALFFGSTEQLLRRIAARTEDARYVIVDFGRVHLADDSAGRLIRQAAKSMAKTGTELVFSNVPAEGPLSSLATCISELAQSQALHCFGDVDAAMEWCEDQLLDRSRLHVSDRKFALAQLELFRGLNAEECHLLERLVRPLIFEKGEIIIREGAPARLFFVLAQGSVGVEVRGPDGDGEGLRRVASIGPGLTFGEMALLDGAPRSARVVADEKVVCYGLPVDELQELGAEHPKIMITILSNLTREFSERLHHAHEEIRALE
ncbi:glutaminase A [Methyloligella sp. 2.7D]|uniref:glutaminase A n=1 Tax=unclassified Methyloligella TaxID=2625955 RepID=UPI001ABA8928|nr:glutaminase A [Methyloligella sp. GL2]